jgi:hypothetical protein
MKARTKFILIVAGMFILATIIDTASDSVDIPLVPDLSINGRELPRLVAADILTHDQVIEELRDAFPAPPRIIRRDDNELADRTYQILDHRSAMELVDWMAEFYWSTPALRYKPEAYDCDNFARTFTVMADLAGAEFFDGQILVVRLYVNQKTRWGGVPSGGQHALVAIRTTKGWQVYEPQGRSVTCAEKYPNRNWVWKIKAD